MEEKNKAGIESHLTRREFVRRSGLVGAASLFAGQAGRSFAEEEDVDGSERIRSTGYAARDETGTLSPWEFERRALREGDVLIDIRYCGVCHSDIHQLRGEWGPETYPQVPGHEITGIVAALGSGVTRFSVGDRVGVGCMVSSCGSCSNCKKGLEHYCQQRATKFTYGSPDPSSPTGITQGGYSNNIVVDERFVIRIPDGLSLRDAAPLLCAGITTYSPLVRAQLREGDKVGVIGIGGLGHVAVKLAHSIGAEVYGFTTSPDKIADITSFGAKEGVHVRSMQDLHPYYQRMDYVISTVPVDFDLGGYSWLVKPYGTFTQVGMPKAGKLTLTHFNLVYNRVNFNGSMIGGVPETQEVVDYCATRRITPQTQLIEAHEINAAWKKVIDKHARYRFVIDAATL